MRFRLSTKIWIYSSRKRSPLKNIVDWLWRGVISPDRSFIIVPQKQGSFSATIHRNGASRAKTTIVTEKSGDSCGTMESKSSCRVESQWYNHIILKFQVGTFYWQYYPDRSYRLLPPQKNRLEIIVNELKQHSRSEGTTIINSRLIKVMQRTIRRLTRRLSPLCLWQSRNVQKPWFRKKKWRRLQRPSVRQR